MTDNPIVGGSALPGGAHGRRDARRVRARRAGSAARPPRSGAPSAATERTFRAGIAALRELRDRDRFFVAVDPFDPVDAVEAPPIYVRAGRGGARGRGADERPARGAGLLERRHGRPALRLPRSRGGRGRLGGQAHRRGARRHARLRGRGHRHRARRARVPRARHAHLAPRLLRDPVPDPSPAGREERRRRGLVRLHARRRAHASLPPGPHHSRQDGRRGPDGAVRRRGSGGSLPPARLDHRERLADHGAGRPLPAGGRPRAVGAPPVRRRRGGGRRQEALRRRGEGRARRRDATVRGCARNSRAAPSRSSAPTGRCARRANAATTTSTTTASPTTSTPSTTSTRTTSTTPKALNFDGRDPEDRTR